MGAGAIDRLVNRDAEKFRLNLRQAGRNNFAMIIIQNRKYPGRMDRKCHIHKRIQGDPAVPAEGPRTGLILRMPLP
jgi:hypothetical protein